jgi:hypothetical protein
MIEVHSLWIGDALSTMEILSLRSHIEVGHKATLWTYGRVANVPSGVQVRDGREIMPESDVFAYETPIGKGSYSACSNLFRYKLLSETEGVWWVDTDVVALKPFDFPDYCVFASERTRDWESIPTTCVIKMSKMIARDCYKEAKHFSSDRIAIRWGVIGPSLLGRMVSAWPMENLRKYVHPPHVFCPVNWYDVEHDPHIHKDVDLSESHAVHLWQEMWRRKGVDKNAAADPNTLYEKLKNKYMSVKMI